MSKINNKINLFLYLQEIQIILHFTLILTIPCVTHSCPNWEEVLWVGQEVWPSQRWGRVPLAAPTSTSSSGTGSRVSWGPCRGHSYDSNIALLETVCHSSSPVCSCVFPKAWQGRRSLRHGRFPPASISSVRWTCCSPRLVS